MVPVPLYSYIYEKKFFLKNFLRPSGNMVENSKLLLWNTLLKKIYTSLCSASLKHVNLRKHIFLAFIKIYHVKFYSILWNTLLL